MPVHRRWIPAALVALLCVPIPARAQAPSDFAISVRGILGATLFAQNARFALGNGQQAQWVDTEYEDWWHGGDVRNARLMLGISGPAISGDWRVNAHVEGDFFGGFNGGGNFADEQPIPRLRLAYIELNNGRTSFRAGQDWALTLGPIATSVSHIGFPLGWGSGGFMTWRFPGVWLSHSLSEPGAATTSKFRMAVMRNSWSDEPSPDQASAGEAGTPQVEARFELEHKGTGNRSWMAYVTGHWDKKDLNGVRPKGTPEPASNDITSWALSTGGRIQSGGLTLQGSGFVGNAMGHHFGHIVQFGDIRGWGAWGQAGFQLAPRWSLWIFAGTDDPDDADLPATDARLQSLLVVPMLQYKSGPFATGFEWLWNRTTVRTASGERDKTGSALLYSVRVDF